MEMTPGKVEILVVVPRFVWTEVQKSDLSRTMSISRNVTGEW